jgi:two-component system, chemotaxis family, protein-glutamate methylesterase/glutaminase
MIGVRPEAIVVGASAGAVDALSVLLPALPRDFPAPLMVVVHVPPDKNSILTDLFRSKCLMQVQEAEDKEPIRDSTIYFAPPDYHVLVERDRRLSLSSDLPVSFSRPSIDVLFESAADAYGPGLIGIILTGANRDGARGLRAIREAGGTTLVQDPDQAHARDMPAAALAECPDARIMSLQEITVYLQEVVAYP